MTEEGRSTTFRLSTVPRVLLWGFVLTLVLAPLALTPVPPSVDYPTHLAKLHLAANLPHDTALAQFYEWRLRFVPNLAQDLVVPPLARVFGTYLALRIFLGWSLVQLILGVCFLRYVLHGRVGLWPLAAVLFLFNKIVFWGFLNFLFASGVALNLLALWILLSRKGFGVRVAVFSALMPVMFFLHLIATAILAFSIGTYQLGRMWRALAPNFHDRAAWGFCIRESLVTGIPMAPLLVLWALSPTSENKHGFRHGGISNFADALFSPFTTSGTSMEYAFGLAVVLIAIVAFGGRQVTIVKPMRLPLVALLLVAAFMPLMFLGVFGTHFRIPFLVGLMALAAVEPLRPRPLFVMVAVLVIGTLFVGRGYGLAAEWRRFDDGLGQYRSAIAKIRPGSTVMMVLDDRGATPSENLFPQEIFWHLSALVVVDSSAFDPLVFSNFRRQSVAVRPDKRYLDVVLGQPVPTDWATRAYRFATTAPGDRRGSAPKPWPGRDWSKWYLEYDYLLRFSAKAVRDPLPSFLTHLARGDWFDLYRIPPAKSATRP